MSAPTGFRAPVEAIREALRLAVEAASLRSVAREAGMSPMGLSNFISGKSVTSYSATVRKLNNWYVRHQAGGRPTLSEDAARAALLLLLDGIPERSRDRGAARLLETLAALHREGGTHVPPWLQALLPPPDPGGDTPAE